MKIKLHNNNDTDSIIYKGTLEEIRQQSKRRISLPDWKDGWSEELDVE